MLVYEALKLCFWSGEKSVSEIGKKIHDPLIYDFLKFANDKFDRV